MTETLLDLATVPEDRLRLFQSMLVSLARLLPASAAWASIPRQLGWLAVDEIQHRRTGEATGPAAVDLTQAAQLTAGEQQVLASELKRWARVARNKPLAGSLRKIARAIAEADLAPAAGSTSGPEKV